jgi:hypothetical protein
LHDHSALNRSARRRISCSNETFVPATEPLILIYVKTGVFLALTTGAGAVLKQSIFEPGSRSALMPAAFFVGGCARRNGRLCAAPPLLRRSGRDLRLSKELHDPARGVAGFNFHDRMDKPRDKRPFYGQRCFFAAMLIIAAASSDFWICRLKRLHALPSSGTQNGSVTARQDAHRRTARELF